MFDALLEPLEKVNSITLIYTSITIGSRWSRKWYLARVLTKNFQFLKRKSDDATITKPVVVTQDSTLRDVLNILTKTRVHRLYVVDNHKRPLGIVTLTDLMETFADPKDN